MEIFKPQSTIDFMKFRGPLIGVSLLLSILGIVAAVFPGPNYGIDFEGGTEVVGGRREAMGAGSE